MPDVDLNTLAVTRPTLPFATVDDVETTRPSEAIPTKSGGNLFVLFMREASALSTKFFTYDPLELSLIPVDTRGLRCFMVKGLRENSVGGREFHRLGHEYVVVLEGSLDMECEDLGGAVRTIRLTDGEGVMVPPMVFHTYQVRAPTSLVVVSSSLLFRELPVTCDAYGREPFEALQRKLRERGR